MWKLHAALAVGKGDLIDIPARKPAMADEQYSRWSGHGDVRWPVVSHGAPEPVGPGSGGRTAARPNLVPPGESNTTDFWYLWDLDRGEAGLRRNGVTVRYTFDPAVFPCVWVSASYGRFAGAYTTILEPCSAMPISLADAVPNGACTTLAAGGSIETSVRFEVTEERDDRSNG